MKIKVIDITKSSVKLKVMQLTYAYKSDLEKKNKFRTMQFIDLVNHETKSKFSYDAQITILEYVPEDEKGVIEVKHPLPNIYDYEL